MTRCNGACITAGEVGVYSHNGKDISEEIAYGHPECEIHGDLTVSPEENPDQLWDDYKDGYRDIDGNVNEPDWIEP